MLEQLEFVEDKIKLIDEEIEKYIAKQVVS
jgi:hypothetical protein